MSPTIQLQELDFKSLLLYLPVELINTKSNHFIAKLDVLSLMPYNLRLTRRKWKKIAMASVSVDSNE